MYQNIPLEFAYRVLGNGRTVLVTTYDRDRSRANVLALAWTTVVSKEPPLAGFVIAKEHHSYGLIEKEREFTVNLPPRDMARLVFQVGRVSGADVDKFIEFGIDTLESEAVTPPSLHECLAHIEYRLERVIDLDPGTALVIGRAVACRALEETFDGGTWNFHHPKVRFLHHLGGDRFAVSTEAINLGKG